jgi:single-stranded-DNA-specific exonuclease
MSGVIEQLLKSRGLNNKALREAFCSPDYEASKHDPFLLPDMSKAVKRLIAAKKTGELVYIYGDYDIDGLTATTLLLDAFKSFGINCDAFIPNRFTEGYGLNKDAMRELAKRGARVVVTVDCGSLSHDEIELANKLGMDVIVTDHHSVAETMPKAVAVINPKRPGHKYPFIDLAGVGVAFKLVQALQQKTDGLPLGQEKWLLDLVALGTVCDVVQLLDENRTNVFWGLQVMARTRRPGLKALIQVAGQSQNKLTARSLGFVLGPRLNAAGRIETAQLGLDLLTSTDPMKAVEIAYRLEELNQQRRSAQDKITKQALAQAANFSNDPVLVLSHTDWSHGIIGIVAAKVLESQQKPTFILQEMGEESKGSARSYGDFSAVDAIRAAEGFLIKGGGHKLAAGVTLLTKDIGAFRQAVNDFYVAQRFNDQRKHFEPRVDVIVEDVRELDHDLMALLKNLEPFGHGNPEPIFQLPRAVIHRRQTLGRDKNHLKLDVSDGRGSHWHLIGFGMAADCLQDVGDEVSVWFRVVENAWNGEVKLEGQMVKLGDFDA